MSAKKPNIFECDGLIIRGPDGTKRAEIEVGGADVGHEVALHMYSATATEIPEPALPVYVDGNGEAYFFFGYAGVNDVRTSARGRSGTEESPPRILYFGRRDGLANGPTLVLDGENLVRRSGFVAAMLEAGREFSTRFGVDEEDYMELMDDVAAVLQFEQETGEATS